MESTLKFDKVVLIKELNEEFSQIGETFEVANILEHGLLLRDTKTKVAIGVISYKDFERCFVNEENFHGWTKWQKFYGIDGQNDCMYRTNAKKVQVHFLTDNVRGEACCCKGDEFNLSFGIRLAYFRARNKAFEKKKVEYKHELEKINIELTDNKEAIQKMINSLPE